MKQFEFNFQGRADDDKDFGCSMRIAGDLNIIGKLLAEYVRAELKQGHPEPMRILIATFEQMQKTAPESEGKIIKPKFTNL